VAQADPNDERAATSLASAHDKLGLTLLKTKAFEDAEREMHEAIAIYDGLVRRGAANWATTRDLANAHDDLADVLEARCGKSCKSRVVAELSTERTMLEGLRQKGLLQPRDLKYLQEVDQRIARMN
jgi:hypothetical protein